MDKDHIQTIKKSTLCQYCIRHKYTYFICFAVLMNIFTAEFDINRYTIYQLVKTG